MVLLQLTFMPFKYNAAWKRLGKANCQRPWAPLERCLVKRYTNHGLSSPWVPGNNISWSNFLFFFNKKLSDAHALTALPLLVLLATAMQWSRCLMWLFPSSRMEGNTCHHCFRTYRNLSDAGTRQDPIALASR